MYCDEPFCTEAPAVLAGIIIHSHTIAKKKVLCVDIAMQYALLRQNHMR
ncbi:hypothetical protein EWM64_g9349 [Hericium alpestre]|uniref:Uncharacterized protein n=1 Tax=Hericium alpestre TaxID=135208 RepID=A0A4Y9ZL44_9AGAM|nr:hypothetical protein EWM64_g9349 [Hericium alpestre]